MNKLFFLLLSCIVAQGSVNAMEQFPLHEAAKSGDIDLVEVLLLSNNNAGINLQDNDGDTPLHWAASNDHEAIVKLLLDKGANANLQNNDGETPLQHEIVRMILAKQKVQEITSTLELALFDESENNQSPLAMLPGDGGQPQILREIIGLSEIAILQEAREPRQ